MIQGLYKCFDHWHKNGTVWIYSDTHFNDSELEIGHPRPLSTEEHIKRINSKVGKKDTLILLGDCGDINCIRQLKGYKVLVMGNHDCGRTLYERTIKTEVFDAHYILMSQVISNMKQQYSNWRVNVKHEGNYITATVDNALFDEVYEGPLIIGEKIILSHEPLDVPWAFNIHGHDHQGTPRRNHLNCCSDVVGYEPINLNQFMKTGPASKIPSIHRVTIDKATERKKRRCNKS